MLSEFRFEFPLPPKSTDTVGSAHAKLDRDSSLVFDFVLETDGDEDEDEIESRAIDFNGEESNDELGVGTDNDEDGLDNNDPPCTFVCDMGVVVKLCKSRLLNSVVGLVRVVFTFGDRSDKEGAPPSMILFSSLFVSAVHSVRGAVVPLKSLWNLLNSASNFSGERAVTLFVPDDALEELPLFIPEVTLLKTILLDSLGVVCAVDDLLSDPLDTDDEYAVPCEVVELVSSLGCTSHLSFLEFEVEADVVMVSLATLASSVMTVVPPPPCIFAEVLVRSLVLFLSERLLATGGVNSSSSSSSLSSL